MSAELIAKLAALELVPPGLWTVIGPVVAPNGTMAAMVVLLETVKLVAATPLKRTAVALVKLRPVMTTFVPGKPCAGVKLLMLGAPRNRAAVVAVPPGVVTLIGPEMMPAGTTAPIVVLLVTKKVAAVPLKLTAVVFVKLFPVILTVVPVPPPIGVKVEILGGK